jgi:hypothetical protein
MDGAGAAIDLVIGFPAMTTLLMALVDLNGDAPL